MDLGSLESLKLPGGELEEDQDVVVDQDVDEPLQDNEPVSKEKSDEQNTGACERKPTARMAAFKEKEQAARERSSLGYMGPLNH